MPPGQGAPDMNKDLTDYNVVDGDLNNIESLQPGLVKVFPPFF